MIKVLHVVGKLNNWALQKRAESLIHAMSADVEGVMISYTVLDSTPYESFDFLHFHGLQVVSSKGRILMNTKIPWGFEVVSERSLQKLDFTKSLVRRASCCWCKNESLLTIMKPHLNIMPIYIPNGVDVQLFKPAPIRVGWVGNERPSCLVYKGVPLIRSAVCKLNLKFDNAFEFVMSPAKYPEVVSHQEMVKFYRSLDVFVCASEAEGCSNVVNEALACGIPVVSTRVGIAGALGGHGLICVDRDVQSIAAGIEIKIKLRLRRTRAIVNNMVQYAWGSPKVAGAYLESYKSVLKDNK